MNDKGMFNLEQKENGSPENQIITLRGIFKTKQGIQPAYNPDTGWYEGVDRITEDDKKKLTYYVTVGETGIKARNNTTIELTDGYTFDLSKERDAINWKWAKHCKEIAHSFEEAQMSKMARFYVVIEGRESAKKNAETNLTFQAQKHVFEDSPVNYENRALLLGHDMTGEGPETIKEFLLDRAKDKKTAQGIIDIYESKSLNIQLLYLKAKKGGKITETANGAIKYGPQVIAMSDEGAIVFLQNKENREILALLEREVNPEYFKDEVKETKEEQVMAPAFAEALKNSDPVEEPEEEEGSDVTFDFTSAKTTEEE